jgi:hypothetical protein
MHAKQENMFQNTCLDFNENQNLPNFPSSQKYYGFRKAPELKIRRPQVFKSSALGGRREASALKFSETFLKH